MYSKLFMKDLENQISLKNKNSIQKFLADIHNNQDDRVKLFHYAAESSYIHILELLLKTYPALVNTQNTSKQTALHLAAGVGHLNVCTLLIKNNATIDIRDIMSETPLHFAARACKEDVCKLLISKKADVNARDLINQTPLIWAIRQNNTQYTIHNTTLILISTQYVNC